MGDAKAGAPFPDVSSTFIILCSCTRFEVLNRNLNTLLRD